LKPGTIFKWKDFPYPQFGGEIKTRWFICLGDSGPLTSPIIAHICTTTTSISDFEKGGKKFPHRFFRFDKTKYPFEQNCFLVLDYDEPPYSEDLKSLEANQNIEIKGDLSPQDLRAIYNGILSSSFYSRKILSDIHASLNRIGITGLRKP